MALDLDRGMTRNCDKYINYLYIGITKCSQLRYECFDKTLKLLRPDMITISSAYR